MFRSYKAARHLEKNDTFRFFLNLEKDYRGKGGQTKSVRQPLVIPSSLDFCYNLMNAIVIPFIPRQE